MSKQNRIAAEETPRVWFHLMPNMIDEMELSPYAYRLYAHLRRVIGENNGECWKSTRTLADACHMSTGSISNAKTELVNASLIIIDKAKRDTDSITLVDVWSKNRDMYFSRYRSPDEHAKIESSSNEHQRSSNEHQRSSGETKKNSYKKNPQEDTTKGATPPSSESEEENLGTPKTYRDWKEALRVSKNRPATARWMFEVLFPDYENPPHYGRFGAVAKKVGGWSVLALKMWELSPRPPVGNPLDYIQKAASRDRRYGRRNPDDEGLGEDEMRAKAKAAYAGALTGADIGITDG